MGYEVTSTDEVAGPKVDGADEARAAAMDGVKEGRLTATDAGLVAEHVLSGDVGETEGGAALLKTSAATGGGRGVKGHAPAKASDLASGVEGKAAARLADVKAYAAGKALDAAAEAGDDSPDFGGDSASQAARQQRRLLTHRRAAADKAERTEKGGGRIGAIKKKTRSAKRKGAAGLAVGQAADALEDSDELDGFGKTARGADDAKRGLRRVQQMRNWATSKKASNAARSSAAAAKTTAKAAKTAGTAAASAAGSAGGAAAAAASAPLLLGVIAAILLLVFSVVLISAISGNDAGDGGSLEGVQLDIYKELKKLDYSDQAIAGILGNIQAESGFDPGVDADDGYGTVSMGLFQMVGSERTAFIAWCNKNGKKWSSAATQIQWTFGRKSGIGTVSGQWMKCGPGTYRNYSSVPGYKKSFSKANSWSVADFKKADSVAIAAYAWMAHYEGCATDYRAHLDNRIKYAEEFYKKIKADNGKGGMGVPRLYQGDYSNVSYGGGTIASSGCAITSGAMVASYLTGSSITPADIVKWAGNTYYEPGAGTKWSFFDALAKKYDINIKTLGNSVDKAYKELEKGHPVICSQDPGIFTVHGHLIVLSGTDGKGGIYVNDPNKNNAVTKGYNKRVFKKSEIQAASKNYWAFWKD